MVAFRIQARLRRSEQFRLQCELVDLENKVLDLPMPRGGKSRLRHAVASHRALVGIGLYSTKEILAHIDMRQCNATLISRRASYKTPQKRGLNCLREGEKGNWE